MQNQEERSVEDRPGDALDHPTEVLGGIGARVVLGDVDEEVHGHSEQELRRKRHQQDQRRSAQVRGQWMTWRTRATWRRPPTPSLERASSTNRESAPSAALTSRRRTSPWRLTSKRSTRTNPASASAFSAGTS